MKTRQKDFTNCHSEIAGALKQGQEVYCNVWDYGHYGSKKDWVTDYQSAELFPYITKNSYYNFAEPVQTFSRVKPAEEIIQWLLDNGYKYSGGDWRKSHEETFLECMFEFCGKEANFYSFLPEWLEEVCE